jgi:hypothetical protein
LNINEFIPKKSDARMFVSSIQEARETSPTAVPTHKKEANPIFLWSASLFSI